MAESRKAMSGVSHGVPEAQGIPEVQGFQEARGFQEAQGSQEVERGPGELSDEELVIAAARQDRERQRSGKAMRLQAVSVMVLAAVACWLVLVHGRIPDAGYVGIGLAVVVAVIAVPFLFGLLPVSPVIPWGNPVRGACPSCGLRRLREGRALHWEDPGSGPRTMDGIVTLCMADGCDHAAVRKVRRRFAGLA
jgi:hypothetical protein